MLYLITQIFLLLALASILSGLIGWLLRAFQSDRSESALKKQLHRSKDAVPSMQRALNAAHFEIDRRENDIHRLRRKIAEIDTNPNNFREGDFDNLNGKDRERHAHDLVVDRATSGNSQFRSSDFDHGIPVTEGHQNQAVEILNTRIEDTDGKYRASDFDGGQPSNRTEQRAADALAAQRTEPETYYRDNDFEHGAPRTAKEQDYADDIVELRDENKAERQAEREYRRVLVQELDKANEALLNAQREADELTRQLGVKQPGANGSGSDRKIADLENALSNSHGEIHNWEQQVIDLTNQIKAIDNDHANFRQGDFDDLGPLTEEDRSAALYVARVTSGNSNFRASDFNNGTPETEQEQEAAAEFLKTRIEDTDGKYREEDFPDGQPVTAEQQQHAKDLSAQRTEPEDHYRAGDFVGEKPETETEKLFAYKVRKLRKENKAERKAAKEHRRELKLELAKANETLDKHQTQAFDLRNQINQNTTVTSQKITDLEGGLTDTQQAIKNWESQVADLSEQIKAIDNNPQNFRQGDLDNLDGRAKDDQATEFYTQRATSGNTAYRVGDFATGMPASNEDKQRAVEIINTRDEDTDGKYREDDFANGVPQTAAEKELSDKIDAMRTEMEKHYRADDFEGERPKSEEEIKLAMQLDMLRAKNKTKRKLAKKQRKDLSEELRKANLSLEEARQNAINTQTQIAEGDASNNSKIEELAGTLDGAQKLIEKQEKQIEDLNQKIKNIDNDPANFREGDLRNLDGTSVDEKVSALHHARIASGNTGFRLADFNNGIPMTQAEKLRAIEFMNSRDEDTEGKYRDGDFANGSPQTAAEKELSAKIDAMRSEIEKHYRANDFAGDKPQSEEEIKLAAQLDVMRAKNKTTRKLAKKQRKDLTDELRKANESLEEARKNAVEVQEKIAQNEKSNNNRFQEFDTNLNSAQQVIDKQEKQIEELNEKIKNIDNDPSNFRDGDLRNLDGTSVDDRISALHHARVASGNTGFRLADFNNGIPMTQAEKLRAIEFMNSRDEDTEGKYRDGDFANGSPQTAAEKELSEKIDAMRSDMEKHYRETDFAEGKPKNEEEIKLAARIDVMRAKNKTQRKLAKERRRDLVNQLEESQNKLDEAKAQIDTLQQQNDEQVNGLEGALKEANSVIDSREARIEELENKIKDIDTDPNHFRAGDMDNLSPKSAYERAMEIALDRATSGNSPFRKGEFPGGVPQTEAEKARAVEILATRDEDTDGKYRQADFANGEPTTAEEKERAAAFDSMRTEPEKHYRDSDFEGDKPQTEAELKLAAKFDVMRVKNKAYRSASKKQRKVLKQDLVNARKEQQIAKEAAAELESRLNGVANTNASLEDIIASLKQDINNKTALEKQAGKKVEELALTINKLEKELTQVTHDGHRKAGDLESELRRVKEDLSKAQQEANLNKHSVQSAQSTLTERTSEREKLQEQMTQLKSDLALANGELSQSKQDVIRLTAEKDMEIHELKLALSTEKDSRTRLEEDMEQLKRELHAALTDDSDRAARQALEMQKAANEARVKELEAILKEHTSSRNQNWEELKKELEVLTTALQRKDSDLRNANTQLNDLQGNLAEYEANDDELRNRVDVLEGLLAEQRMLTGQTMTSRIREIESMLSAERRKVESMTLESNVAEAAHYEASIPKKVIVSNRFNKKPQ